MIICLFPSYAKPYRAVGEPVTAHQGEVSASAGTRHLPRKHPVHGGVAVDVILHPRLDHRGEHRHLGLERGPVGSRETLEILSEDGAPAGIRGICQSLDTRPVYLRALHNRAAGTSREHRDQAQVSLKPVQNAAVRARLEARRPVVTVVVVAHQTRHADPYRVLSTRDDAVRTLRVVLEAEHKLRQDLRVHVGQLVRPDVPDAVAGRRGQTATLPYLERRLEGHRYSPARGVTGHVRLVDPRPREVQTRGDAARVTLQGSARARVKAVRGYATQHHVLDPPLPAERLLFGGRPVLVHHEHVRTKGLHSRDEVHDAAPGVDERVLDVPYGPDHEQALLLRIHSVVVLVILYRRVGADADVKVAVGRSLAEELHVTAVEQVVAPRHEHLFPVCHTDGFFMLPVCFLGCSADSARGYRSALIGLLRKSAYARRMPSSSSVR